MPPKTTSEPGPPPAGGGTPLDGGGGLGEKRTERSVARKLQEVDGLLAKHRKRISRLPVIKRKTERK